MPELLALALRAVAAWGRNPAPPAPGDEARAAALAGASLATDASGSDGFTFTASNPAKTVNNQTPLVVAAFDETQITHPANRSALRPGGPAGALAAGTRPPAVVALGPAVAFTGKEAGGDAAEGIAPTLRAMGFDRSHMNGGGQVAVAMVGRPLGFNAWDADLYAREDAAPALTVGRGDANAIAFALRGRAGGAMAEAEPGAVAPALRAAAGGASNPFVAGSEGDGGESLLFFVRRLTPTECERLQGFPDGHTAISRRGGPAADAPRYHALGNSQAVPNVGWILGRIGVAFRAAS